ncbi:cytochrome P450 CYP12A2-like [Musca autumnalis]|uniref:cytochrome P450 CYP12A2-like n=1 Tax=Musca autumnalis TaxID=221902 RepID=UPI003CF47D1E
MSLWSMFRNFAPGGKYANLDATQMILTWKEDYGPLLRMKGGFGRPDSITTHNPQDFEIIMRNEGKWPQRSGPDAMAYHRSVHRADVFQGVEGLLGTRGEKWGTYRSSVNPILMNPKNVRHYLPKLSQVNKELLQRILEIRNPSTLEVPASFLEELNRWTLESVSVVALDKQLGLISTNRNNPEALRLFHLMREFFTYTMKVEIMPPIWKYYKTKSFLKYMDILDGITEITHKYVKESIDRLEKGPTNEGTASDNSDKSVLEKLIKIDKKLATVVAMDMLLGGIDTTTSAMFATLLCLAKNPEKQDKLRQELVEALPHKTSDFNEESFTNLPYLRAFIKESLRVYPIMMANMRTAGNDMIISGYQVPKGTQVVMVYLTLLNNDEYFPKASEFLPERWLRLPDVGGEVENKCPPSLKSKNPFIYLPFGFGSRSCVGRRIVEMEMELAIARLVRNFYIEYNYPTENAFKSLLVNVPNIPLTFKFIDVEK